MNVELRKQILDEINLCRTNPSNYANKLETFLTYYNGFTLTLPNQPPLLTIDGQAACLSAIDYLRAMTPRTPLIWSDSLSFSAQDHCNDKGSLGEFGHTGSLGSTLLDRVTKYGKPEEPVGENIMYGQDTPENIVCMMLVDDGVPARGNRKNLMNERYTLCGIGFAAHLEMDSMCTLVMAGGFTPGVQPDLTELVPKRSSILLGGHSAIDDYFSGRPVIKLTDWGGPILSRVPQDVATSIRNFRREFGLEKMPDLPEGVKSVREIKRTKTENGQQRTKHFKIYTMDDGTEVTEHLSD